MADYLTVPLKKTYEVDPTKPLKNFISDTYSTVSSDDYNNAISEFNKLRNQMISKSLDKHESALEVLNRYYDQLVAIESKLPISENQIRINYKWQDAFDKESFFVGKRTLTISSSAYEKVCLLFNIGSLQSQIADTQNHTSDDGLKTAAKLYQQCAGVFSHLKDCVLSHVQQEPTPDLHPDTLSAISSVMLAQAQECVYRKAAIDKMKDAIVAKLANHCSDLYADALKQLQLHSLRELWPKEWIPCVAGKQAGFHAMAEYHMSLSAKSSKTYGEEIARLKHAVELLDASSNRAGTIYCFKNEESKIKRALQDAEKDNNFIYHDKVPERNSLSAIGKATVAKALPLSSPMSKDFKDLFEKIVPLAVHQAMTSFDNRKAEIINMEVGRLREQTQLLNSVMASLNLPAAIEDLSGEAVPSSLLEKARTLKENGGGIDYINKLMTELPELLTRNREILDESMKQLDHEGASDIQLREQFKEKWTRTPSNKLTEPIRQEGTKYKGILDTAIQADHIVKEKYGVHKDGILLLSKSEAEIAGALPSGNPAAAMKDQPSVVELKQFMEQVDTIKAERDVMENEIKEAKCDMASTFMGALAADGAIQEDMLSSEQLERIYGPLREQVRDSINRQEALLNNIQRANTEFCNAKSSNQSAARRETMLKDLAAAFDNYMELKGNLEEGTKFYNDLTQLLVRFQNKVTDFCFARKTEKEELLKDVQTSIANQPSQPPPKAPAYQQAQPPARPPPPTLPASQPAVQPAAQPPTQAAPPSQFQPPYGQGGMPYPANPGYGAPAAPQQYPQAGGGYPSYTPQAMPSGFNPYAQYGQQPPQYNPYGQPQAQYPPQRPPAAPYPQQQQQQQQPPYGYPPQGQYPGQPQWR